MVRVTEVSAEETHALRRAVLRADMPESSVVFEGDDDPAAIHLAAFDEGRMIGVATFFPSPLDGRAAWQLRGMAVAVDLQGTGVGAALLRHGVERVRAAGGGLVWANGRDTALGFYRRHGWEVVGEGFVYGPMRLPHHVVVLRF